MLDRVEEVVSAWKALCPLLGEKGRCTAPGCELLYIHPEAGD